MGNGGEKKKAVLGPTQVAGVSHLSACAVAVSDGAALPAAFLLDRG